MEQYTQIIITIIGVLGSASIWKCFRSKIKIKVRAYAS